MVWVKPSGREALVKFTYKDSAKRAMAAHSRSSEFQDLKLSQPSADTISDFLRSCESKNDVIRETRADFGIPHKARFKNGTYEGQAMPSLSELEDKVRARIAQM